MGSPIVFQPTAYTVTRKLIRDKIAHIGIVGLGHVGLPLALMFTGRGLVVEGFDIDADKVKKLNDRQSYLWSIAPEEISIARDRGFHATTDMSQISEMDVVVICVPTRLTAEQEPDVAFIRETAFSIAPHLHAGQLIILEGTTYPGTTEEVVLPILESANCSHLRVSRDTAQNDEVFLAFSSEYQDHGNTSVDRRDVPKVVGGVDKFSTQLAIDLYQFVFREVIPVSTPAAAEMSNLVENIYRFVNVGLVNELKQICMRIGIDIWEVIDVARSRPFGFEAFYPGPGLGGHSTRVGPFYLSWKAKTHDVHAKFIELAAEVNARMPDFVVRNLSDALNTRMKCINGSSILVLGIAYKKDTNDLYESPALAIIELLRRAGAHVDYNDPFLPYVGRGAQLELNLTSTSIEDVSGYDAVIIATDHSCYDYERIVSQAKLVIDTRNATRGIESDKIVRS
jgi:UDP-N-acetyl-D-glucosamine dehydrogenase